MSARLASRALSPALKKICVDCAVTFYQQSPPLGASYQTSATKLAESPSKKSTSSATSSSSKSKSPSDQNQKADKKESYAAGEAFFGYNNYSFYDFEIDMEKDRIVQPSSEKANPSFSS